MTQPVRCPGYGPPMTGCPCAFCTEHRPVPVVPDRPRLNYPHGDFTDEDDE